MPASYTHAVYGEMVLNKLDPETKKRITPYLDLYNIGLHGPDILFFYKPVQSNPVKKLGYDMHNLPAREFFEQARKKITESSDPDAALAYILGFINHFVLDSLCHPFIYQHQDETGLSHSEIESEWDRELMVRQGKDPIRSRTTGHLHPSQAVCQVIAPFFDVQPQQINEALKTMIWLLNMFVAPGKLKRGFILSVMQLVGMRKSQGGLIFNYEPNPYCVRFVDERIRQMDQACDLSVKLIGEYLEKLHTDLPLDPWYDEDYE